MPSEFSCEHVACRVGKVAAERFGAGVLNLLLGGDGEAPESDSKTAVESVSFTLVASFMVATLMAPEWARAQMDGVPEEIRLKLEAAALRTIERLPVAIAHPAPGGAS